MTNVNTDSNEWGLVLGNKVLVAEVFAKNGFLVLSSVTGEKKTAEVNAKQASLPRRNRAGSPCKKWEDPKEDSRR